MMGTERYDRQIRIPQLGPDGQQRLARSRVLVVGAGGLGSAALLYLAAAGVGTIGIADGDSVELSNLNRQILHRTADVGVAKVVSAARALADLNPDVSVTTYCERLDLDRAIDLARAHDLLVDATDGFASKYLLNEAAVRSGRPLVHAGVEGLMGQLALLAVPGGPCLRCIFPEPPSEPASARPVLGATAGVLGALQAAEAIKFLAGMGERGGTSVLVVDLLALQLRRLRAERDPQCPICGPR
ncbi:MAG: HesA/MoeB/ThiF family protein [Deltaproteobacteria bacterium]|nr:HesA/MoeB/ThiF family protein [Deltaproteobacteria bacterium]